MYKNLSINYLYWLTYLLLSLALPGATLLAQTEASANAEPPASTRKPSLKEQLLVMDEEEPNTPAEPVLKVLTTTIPRTLNSALATYLPDDDAYAIVGNMRRMLLSAFHHDAAGDLVFVSSGENGDVNGVEYKDEDILVYDTTTGVWRLFFDGSDVEVRNDVNGFTFLLDGSMLLTFKHPTYVPGVGQVQNADIVRFIPSRWGDETNGRFEWALNGSDVGLAAEGEDVDGIAVLPDGRLVLSTRGSFRVGPPFHELHGKDEDLLVFTPTRLGYVTEGTWGIYLTGERLGFGRPEDIQAIWIDNDNGDIYMTTDGNYFTVVAQDGTMRNEALVYASGALGTSTQANAGSGVSLDQGNNTTFGNFDGLVIVR